ncbi:MAG: hypothetical protein V2A58_15355 [Planctomycetota bacterium]
MRVEKRHLADLEMVYAVREIRLSGQSHILAASERRGGACLLFSPPDWRTSVAWEGPGGGMSLSPVPGREGTLLAIQKFFPVFQSEEAGLYLARAGADPHSHWTLTRVADLPFAHRLEVVEVGGQPHLVAATLCAGKSFQDDWSQPGAVYIGPVAIEAEGSWPLARVLTGITRNHGMQVTALADEGVVLVSGDEGLFSLGIPRDPGGEWRSRKLIGRPISDMAAADLNADGQTEIVTIEPFHGDRLVVWKRKGEDWQVLHEAPLDFGHVVWAGTLLGGPAILAGSRGGDRGLVMLAVTSTDPFSVKRTLLDGGIGPTQVAVIRQGSTDLIVSANHGVGEVALYKLAR